LDRIDVTNGAWSACASLLLLQDHDHAAADSGPAQRWCDGRDPWPGIVRRMCQASAGHGQPADHGKRQGSAEQSTAG
jgi:hypothetical protein